MVQKEGCGEYTLEGLSENSANFIRSVFKTEDAQIFYPDYYQKHGTMIDMDDKFLIPTFIPSLYAWVNARYKDDELNLEFRKKLVSMTEKYLTGHSRTEALFRFYLSGKVRRADMPNFVILDTSQRKLFPFSAFQNTDSFVILQNSTPTDSLTSPVMLSFMIYSLFEKGQTKYDVDFIVESMEAWMKYMSSKKMRSGGVGSKSNSNHDFDISR